VVPVAGASFDRQLAKATSAPNIRIAVDFNLVATGELAGQRIGRLHKALIFGPFQRVSATRQCCRYVLANFLAETFEAVFGRASIVIWLERLPHPFCTKLSVRVR
jgi:hypothetical protein